MSRLTKQQLLFKFTEAVRASGLNVLYLRSDHPALYRIFNIHSSYNVSVYIWNISHGGRNRPDDEYRIQITGATKLTQYEEARNLVLGWRDDLGVFAGWDIRQHSKALGASPSLQINEKALFDALKDGFAPYFKENKEVAIAFRPDFIGIYIQNLHSLHDAGKLKPDSDVFRKINSRSGVIDEDYIKKNVTKTRQMAMTSVLRYVREHDFRDRVLSAYGNSCAMCGAQLRLVDGAHILPVSEPGSTDHTSNGVALCALHHRAYDKGLITFDSKYKIHINGTKISILKNENRSGGIKAFSQLSGRNIEVPDTKFDRPDVNFVRKANSVRGWNIHP